MPTNCNWAFRVKPCKGNDFIPVFFHVKVQYFSSAFYRGGVSYFWTPIFISSKWLYNYTFQSAVSNKCLPYQLLLATSTSDIPISADSKYIHLCQINEKLLCLVSWIKIAQAQKNIYTFTTTNTINLAIWILIHKT